MGVLCQEFALESIGQVFLGSRYQRAHVIILFALRLGSFKKSEDSILIRENAEVFFSGGLATVALPMVLYQWTAHYRRMVGALATVGEVTSRHVATSLEALDPEDLTDKSALAKMVRRCGKDSPAPTVMAMDALFGGVDATGHALAFLLHHLARHPKAQERLAEEVQDILGNQGILDTSSLAKMKYLKACLQESMRLLPVAAFTVRTTQEAMVLGGFQVPVGTWVVRCSSSPPLLLQMGHAHLHRRWPVL